MKKAHLIILGAGKPHLGKDPSSLLKVFKNINTLNFVLNFARELKIRTTYVSGYRNDKIKKKFPDLRIIHNKDWDKTGPLYSLNNIKFNHDENVIILYSDVLIRFEDLKKLVNNNDEVACLIDSNYKNRYKYRDNEDLASKEKIYFNNPKSFYFSQKFSLKKSAELLGAIKISYKRINFFQTLINKINIKKNSYKLLYLLERSKIKNNIKFIDVKGDWAEINKEEDISKFILGTKSETLKRLKNIVKKGKILDQVKFTVLEWNKKKFSIINQINKKFKKKFLIVRSSAIDEDGINTSNAGKYLSVLNVKGDQKIISAVNKVIDSFQEIKFENEIFVQEQIKNSQYVGVVTTKSKRTGSPWYVVNYQKTKDTELITKGDTNKTKTIFLRRDLIIKDLKNVFLKKLLVVIKEIENVLSNNNLDIEFAIDNKNKIFIFQVRPLFVKPENKKAEKTIIKNYKISEIKYKKYKVASKLSNSKNKIFGVMPDWNPAEIIGFKPGKLALSIYQKLITQNIWAKQRYEFGYNKINNPKLIESFCGTPYVSVNKSIESFISRNLSKNISKKILDISLENLKKNPNKHDKIEFEIIPNCLDFDFHKWVKFYKKENLNNLDIKKIKESLNEINKNAQSIYLKNSSKLDHFNKLNLGGKHSNKAKVKSLLDICERELTLMFAHFARCGFVAVIIMKSALKNKKISKKNYNNFFNSINTISKDFQRDISFYKNNKISKKKVLKKYGHLRPGTYDITSQRYDENSDLLFKGFYEKTKIKNLEIKKNSVFNKNFLKELSKIGFKGDKKQIIDFFYGSIEKRESSKFLFTKFLSDLLKLFSKELNKKNFSNKEIYNLDLKNILDLFNGKINRNNLKKIIQNNHEKYKIDIACDMPNLIFSIIDFKKFELLNDEPNFVGEDIVFSNLAKISKFENSNILNNKIILIDSADPGYDWIFRFKIKGLITKYGGVNSHMAIRCAELNLTAAIGVGEKTFQNLLNSNKVLIDPKNKILKLLS